MSESMIERVAKAIAKARGGWHADEGQWRSCEDEARAAIEAMRDPTEAMTLAMLQAWETPPGEDADSSDMTPNWKAAIDAALAEIPTRMEMKR